MKFPLEFCMARVNAAVNDADSDTCTGRAAGVGVMGVDLFQGGLVADSGCAAYSCRSSLSEVSGSGVTGVGSGVVGVGSGVTDGDWGLTTPLLPPPPQPAMRNTRLPRSTKYFIISDIYYNMAGKVSVGGSIADGSTQQ